MTTLFVAISGGHLAQLHRLSPRLAQDEVAWVTDSTGQSRSLLAGEQVTYIPTRPPRDWAGVLRDSLTVGRALKASGATRVVSTGSQIALSAYLASKRNKVPFAYVESATRVTELSTTGKILDHAPGVHRYVQHTSTAPSPKWQYRLSVFDGYDPEQMDVAPTIQRVVVTMGGNGEYPFTKLAERVRDIIPAGIDVLWQLGSTPTIDLPGRVVASLPSHELADALKEADVVVGHSGTGTALAALAASKLPVLSPRLVDRGEHVDGHQEDLARALSERGLAVVRQADELTLDDLKHAAGFRVRSVSTGSFVDLFRS